ncbi:complement C1r-B subcomponent-like [Platysternon megacephalum]|uniref:Complement C1r-B subcomponent-like n=1 Tax=Platysternon megacephalum TaxID=55544 RepID=A0A4D9E6D2_9SAUR|nr:complement C1r-B subcomponent-like [Platysternon megacephalum]
MRRSRTGGWGRGDGGEPLARMRGRGRDGSLCVVYFPEPSLPPPTNLHQGAGQITQPGVRQVVLMSMTRASLHILSSLDDKMLKGCLSHLLSVTPGREDVQWPVL